MSCCSSFLTTCSHDQHLLFSCTIMLACLQKCGFTRFSLTENVSWCFHACDYFQVPERIQPVNRPCREIKNNSAALSGGVVVLNFFVCNDSEAETICLILTYIDQLTFKYFVEQMGLPSTYRGSFVSFYRNGTGDLLLIRVVGQTRPQTLYFGPDCFIKC